METAVFGTRAHDRRFLGATGATAGGRHRLTCPEPRLPPGTAVPARGAGDVREEEGRLFFQDLSGTVVQDDVLARLPAFPKVPATAHRVLFTGGAPAAIAGTAIANATAFGQAGRAVHEVSTGKPA